MATAKEEDGRSLDTTAVLAQFDALQAAGELFYSLAKPSRSTHGGLDVEFRLVPSFNAKPHLSSPGSSKTETAQSAHRPPPSDGSDIDHSDPAFFVAWVAAGHDIADAVAALCTDVNEQRKEHTHKLILNKFCVARPQYLLLTVDATQKQTEALRREDLQAAWLVLEAMRSKGSQCYVIFNGGREAGSSRAHKHLQVLELPDEQQGDRRLLWPGISPKAETDDVLPLPFLAFATQLRRDSADAVDKLDAAYSWQYDASRRALAKEIGVDLSGVGVVPHNVILTREYCITIPRRSTTVEGIEGHLVGAQGMLGLVWCNNQTQIEGWRSTGPIKVLKGLGVPNTQ